MRTITRVAAMALALALAACAGAPAAQAPTSQPAPTADTAAQTATAMPVDSAPTADTAGQAGALPSLTVTDALGRQVTFNAIPERIVSIAPSTTEILFAVGAGDKVVGVTKYCNYPPEADALPEIGGYSADSISVEAIVNLTPDLVVAGTADQAPVVEALDQAGIPALVFDPKSFDEVYANIEQIGDLTGTTAQADEVVAEMRGRIQAVTEKVATVPAEERPTVFYEVFDEPLLTAGPNTFIGQMIALVGATSIFADAGEDYPTVSAEAIIERDPDAIVGPDSHGDKLTPELLAQRPGWGDLSAVKERRIYLLDGDMVSRPGPRLADATEALATVLYPEIFP